jgi:hypothetical protein
MAPERVARRNPVRLWLVDEQASKVEPLLPADTGGGPEVDGHLIISDIAQILFARCGRLGRPILRLGLRYNLLGCSCIATRGR